MAGLRAYVKSPHPCSGRPVGLREKVLVAARHILHVTLDSVYDLWLCSITLVKLDCEVLYTQTCKSAGF